jgi:serine/threonine-protein kinase
MLDRRSSEATADDLIGKELLGRYRVVAVECSTQSGALYRGIQMPSGPGVLLRVVRSERIPDMEAARLFHLEAKMASALKCPHTALLKEFGESDSGDLLLVLGDAKGRSLRECLDGEGQLQEMKTARIGAEIALSLAEAHSVGLRHMNLVPENIYLEDVFGKPDFVKVREYGLSQFGPDLMTHGGTGMAPEQSRIGRLGSSAIDIHALGLILFECVTGRRPYGGDSTAAPRAQAANMTEDISPELASEGFRNLVNRMLSTDPGQRPSASDAAEQLERLRKTAWVNQVKGGAPEPAPERNTATSQRDDATATSYTEARSVQQADAVAEPTAVVERGPAAVATPTPPRVAEPMPAPPEPMEPPLTTIESRPSVGLEFAFDDDLSKNSDDSTTVFDETPDLEPQFADIGESQAPAHYVDVLPPDDIVGRPRNRDIWIIAGLVVVALAGAAVFYVRTASKDVAGAGEVAPQEAKVEAPVPAPQMEPPLSAEPPPAVREPPTPEPVLAAEEATKESDSVDTDEAGETVKQTEPPSRPVERVEVRTLPAETGAVEIEKPADAPPDPANVTPVRRPPKSGRKAPKRGQEAPASRVIWD